MPVSVVKFLWLKEMLRGAAWSAILLRKRRRKKDVCAKKEAATGGLSFWKEIGGEGREKKKSLVSVSPCRPPHGRSLD